MASAPIEVLLWESNSESPNFHDHAPNVQHSVVPVANPDGAQSMVVTFACFDAGNDWWWAIDNVQVAGGPTHNLLQCLLGGSLQSRAGTQCGCGPGRRVLPGPRRLLPGVDH